MWWVVMLTGPTETPTIMGLYRSRGRAERQADRWNRANPPDPDDTEPYQAIAWSISEYKQDA